MWQCRTIGLLALILATCIQAQASLAGRLNRPDGIGKLFSFSALTCRHY